MSVLVLSNLPATLIAEINEWAALRQTTPERAAVELLRIGLHATSDRGQTSAARTATSGSDRGGSTVD